MFDPKEYREACAHLTVGTEKLEEMITMTENTNTKKHLSRPIKTVLIAAACVAALCITAFAAPAVQKLFMSATITFTDYNGDSQTAQMFTCPDLTLENRDGKDILSVDGEEIDVTDAFAKDGQYVMELDQATVTVKPDGEVTVEMTTADGPVVYSFNLSEDDGNLSSSVGTVTVEGDVLTGGEVGIYSVITDENGEMVVTDYSPAQ